MNSIEYICANLFIFLFVYKGISAKVIKLEFTDMVL